MAKIATDLEQSKKLAEFLPLESSDMVYTMTNGYHTPWIRIEKINELDRDDVCAWSLAALLNVLPILERRGYQKDKPRLLYNVTINKWIVDSHVYTTDAYDNPVDACYELILKLHKLKLL